MLKIFILKEEINEETIQEAPSALVSDHVDVPIFYAIAYHEMLSTSLFDETHLHKDEDEKEEETTMAK